jgi:hypothetical protein
MVSTEDGSVAKVGLEFLVIDRDGRRWAGARTGRCG